MTTISKPFSPFAVRFWHRPGFVDYRKAHSRRWESMAPQLLGCSGKSITVENGHPTPLPGGMRYIGQLDHATIQAGHGESSSNASSINAHPDPSLMLGEYRLGPDLAPPSLIHLPVFQGLIAALPLPRKKDRATNLGASSLAAYY